MNKYIDQIAHVLARVKNETYFSNENISSLVM